MRRIAQKKKARRNGGPFIQDRHPGEGQDQPNSV
jgi:hypothetical protein